MVIDGTVYTNEGKDQVLTSGNYSNYAAAKSHTHNYAGSSSAGGDATRSIAVKDSTNGKDITITYGKSGQASTSWLASWNGQELGCISPSNVSVGKVNGHTVNSDVPSGAKFTDTNTWRGIQNNLTSDSTSDSLSAAQGKVLKGLVDGKAASNHSHTAASVGAMAVVRTSFNTHSVYVRLGTATLKQDGSYLLVKLATGNGYNASASQDVYSVIHVRASNGTASNGRYFAGYVEHHQCNGSSYAIYVYQKSSTQFELWTDKVNYSGASFCTAQVPDGCSWSNNYTTASSLPSGSWTLENKTVAYTDIIQYGTSAPSTLANGRLFCVIE